MALALTTTLGSGCDLSPEPGPGRLHVTSAFADEVLILDAASGQLLDRRSVDPRPGETDEPHGIAVAPDGEHWYVTAAHGEPTLWKYESRGDRLVGRVRLGTAGAGRIGITPDGTMAFVPDYWRSGQGRVSRLAVVRLDDLTVLEIMDVCPAPHDAQVDPSGSTVAVTCALSDEIVFLDAHTLVEKGRWSVGDDPGPPGAPRYRPMNVIWSPEGSGVYATLMAAARVLWLPADGSPLRTVSVGREPTQLAWMADRIVVANRGDRSVSVLATTPVLSEIDRIVLAGADHPHGVAVDARAHTAFLTFEGTVDASGGVLALDIDGRRELWRTRVDAVPIGVAWGPGAR